MPAAVAMLMCGHLFNGNDAAVLLWAAGVLKLNGSVADVKTILEDVVQIEQNASALRRRNVGDGHVAGQGATCRS